MYNRILGIAVGMTLFATLVVFPRGVAGQDAAFTWANSTELSFVSTNGNASASSNSLGMTIVVAGTDRYSLFGASYRNDISDEVDTVVYGSGNTIYDFGVDETLRIAGPTAHSTSGTRKFAG